MTIVSIILDVLFLIVVALIMIMCVKDLIDTHRWS